MKRMSLGMTLFVGMCLAVLSACGGGGEADVTASEISDEQLSLMVLPSEYLSYVSDFAEPYADIQEEPASWSNQDVIEDDFDPEDERGDVERFGRLTGYHHTYTRWEPLLEGKGTIMVDTMVDLFGDPQGASGYFRDSLTDAEGQVGQEKEGTIFEQVETFSIDSIADETTGLRMRLTTRAIDGDELALYATAILFRRGRLLADAAIIRADDKDVVAEVEALARKLDERIQAVLRGDISPSPAAATPTAAPETPTPAATPTPSPTPEVAACPDDDPAFCAFAIRLEQAIADEDAEFFVVNSLTQSIPCTAEEAEAGYICGPEQIGETITGVPFGWEASEGTLLPLDDYRDMWVQLFASDLPAEEDADGSGELRIWGLAYPGPPAEGKPRNIVVTYINDTGPGPERQAISLYCEVVDGRWQIRSLLQHALFLGLPRDTAAEWRDWSQ